MAYLVEIYVLYGLSFTLLGAVALLQPVDRDDLPISEHFWLLGLFGILHGGKELFDAWVYNTAATGSAVAWTGCLLLIVSFLPLIEFGRRATASVARDRGAAWAGLTSPWLYLPLLLVMTAPAAFSSEPTALLSALSRYLLGFPGALLAGLMLGQAFHRRAAATQLVRFAFVAYAIFGGLIAERVYGFPSWLPTPDTFLETTGIPVQVLRALCAFTVMVALSILVRDKARETLAQARAHAAEVEDLATSLESHVEERTAALRTSERQFKEAQRVGRIGSWELDIARNHLSWSDEIFRMFEIDPAHFGTSYEAFLAAIHPDDRDLVNGAYRDSLKSRQPYEITHRLRMPDGRIKWVHEHGETEFSASGEPLISRGTVQDVTERRLAEDAIVENEERLRLATELAGLGHWVWDAVADKCIFCSKENARIHGTSVEGYMTKAADLESDFGMVHPDDQEVVKAHFEALRRGTAFDIEYRLVTPGGDIRYVREMARAVFDDDGRVIREHGSILDLSEMKGTEDQLRQAQKMEAVGQLTGGVAHDFNNILATVLGNLELIEDRLNGDEKLQQLLETAIRATERGANLTQRLLAFSRKQPLRPEPVSVEDLVQGMLDLIRRTLGATVDVQVHAANDLWLTEIDPGQLENAILNLAINARDAMPGGGRLTIEQSNAELTDEYAAAQAEVEPGDYVLITVSDTGSGMPPEVRERVFEPFFTTKEVGKGTGLGLSMIFGFVKQSGGHVSVYSEIDKGTSIKLYLPRYKGQPQLVTERGGAETLSAAKGEVILVTEDDPDLRLLLLHLLQSLDYKVLESANGESALEILRGTSQINLLLTDVVLPGEIDGMQLAALAREVHPNLPLLFTSGYSENAPVIKGRPDDSIELLEKPFRKVDLARKVRSALDGQSTPIGVSRRQPAA